MREVGEAEARIGGRQRLVHQHRRDRIEAGAAVVLGHREPEQAELAGSGGRARRLKRSSRLKLRRLRLHLVP